MAKKTTSSNKTSSPRGHSVVLGEDACPACGTTMEQTAKELTFWVNGEETAVPDAAHLRCPKCKEVVLRFDEARRLRERAFEIYQKQHGLLVADEIRSIRERLGLTQGTLARMLRLGSNTISRWEAGRTVQTAALDLLLRLIRDVPEAREHLRKLNYTSEPLTLPLEPRETFQNSSQQALLSELALLRESGGSSKIMRFVGACALLSSPESMVKYAPKGVKRIAQQWSKTFKEVVPIDQWLLVLNDLAERGTIRRVPTPEGIELTLNVEGLPGDQLDSIEEWSLFDARLALHIIDSVDALARDPILHSFSEADIHSFKVGT